MKRDLVTAMQRLIAHVKQDKNAIVVFDGNPPSPFSRGDAQIVFVHSHDKKFEQADEYILDKIRRGTKADVVTKDSAFASSLRQLGVKVKDPRRMVHTGCCAGNAICS